MSTQQIGTKQLQSWRDAIERGDAKHIGPDIASDMIDEILDARALRETGAANAAMIEAGAEAIQRSTPRYGGIETARQIAIEVWDAMRGASLTRAQIDATDGAGAQTVEGVEIDYTNYRGERGRRVIVPTRVWFGSTEYHRGPQWFLKAFDPTKKDYRDFALKDIHAFGRPSPALRAGGGVTEALTIINNMIEASRENAAHYKDTGRDHLAIGSQREVDILTCARNEVAKIPAAQPSLEDMAEIAWDSLFTALATPVEAAALSAEWRAISDEASIADLSQDTLWLRLSNGTADAEAQRDAARWIVWLRKFLPEDQRTAALEGRVIFAPLPSPPSKSDEGNR